MLVVLHGLKESKHAASYLISRAAPTAAGPQTGVGLPNGLRRSEFRSSEIPIVRIFDEIVEKTHVSKRVFEDPGPGGLGSEALSGSMSRNELGCT